MNIESSSLTRQEIERLLPHRRPFLFIENAWIIKPGIHAVEKLADLSEPDFDFLKGHLPDFRVVPGAIIMEGLAELDLLD